MKESVSQLRTKSNHLYSEMVTQITNSQEFELEQFYYNFIIPQLKTKLYPEIVLQKCTEYISHSPPHLAVPADIRKSQDYILTFPLINGHQNKHLLFSQIYIHFPSSLNIILDYTSLTVFIYYSNHSFFFRIDLLISLFTKLYNVQYFILHFIKLTYVYDFNVLSNRICDQKQNKVRI